MPIRRPLAVLALAALAAAPAAAHAHSALLRTSPADGAGLRKAPREITVTFGSPLVRVVSVRVTRNGERAKVASVRLDSRNARRMVVRLQAPGRGTWRARWTVLSPDGHRQSGDLTFRVAGTRPA